jgi:hypothetical protein
VTSASFHSQVQVSPSSTLAMSLEDAYVLENVQEMLGPSCDPQLRLVSKSCHTAMAIFPRAKMRLEDYMSVGLFLWAVEVLKLPWRGRCIDVAAGGGHLEVLGAG